MSTCHQSPGVLRDEIALGDIISYYSEEEGVCFAYLVVDQNIKGHLIWCIDDEPGENDGRINTWHEDDNWHRHDDLRNYIHEE